MLKLLIVGICAFYGLPLYAKLCQDVSVWNNVTEYEINLRNCTTIVGFLKILPIENATAEDYENISFPELTEIKGYLLMYRVFGITTLAKLFPNLAVIRGQNLFVNYAFVLYEMPELKEIGLHNLKYIGRGSTRIEKCPHLCYVNSINWTSIGGPSHKLYYYDEDNIEDCESCPVKCKEGLCWNQEQCQIMESDKCHPECIGCNGTTAYNCSFCRNYQNNDLCVQDCPKNRIRHHMLSTCVKKKDCPILLEGTWWPFQGECISECPPHYKRVDKNITTCEYCGDTCPKVCSGTKCEDIACLETLHGCTYIDGSLMLRIDTKSAADELEKNLDMIEEISGYLQIYRSPPLTTLEFFKNLKVIHGNELSFKRHALVVYENQNLHKLWNWDNFNLTIKNGNISFHYNAQLCFSEIEALAQKTGVKYSEYDVSPYSNGDKRACNYIELNVTIEGLTSSNLTLTWDDFVLTSTQTVLVGYVLYYVQDPYGNITIYDERDECDGNNWDSIFTPNNSQEILNLNAYTQYAYYIKTYTNPPSQGGQTRVGRFTTYSDDPTDPEDIEASSSTSDSVMLIWKPPMFPNGLLSGYELVIYYEEDDAKFLEQRNYCKNPHQIQINEVIELPIKINSTANISCNCKKENQNQKKFDFSCDKMSVVMMSDSKLNCKNYMYSVDDGETIYNVNNSNLASDNHKIVKRAYLPAFSNNIIETTIKGANLTTYTVDSLQHFSMYIFLLKVCNTNSQCSAPVMTSQRTLPKIDADDIPPGISIQVNMFDVTLKWQEPKQPNSLIVSYNIEHKRTDLENSKTITECITRQDFVAAGYEYQMLHFLIGKYSVRVKATSLAGPGRFSEFLEFEILIPPSNPSLGVILAVITALIVFTLFTGFHYYKYYHNKKFILDQQHLISEGSSDYSGPMYVQDDWELMRDDVDVCKEIGKGSFGTVYNGFIKSQNRPCAIKTVDEDANIYDRMVFLNEASIMKAFSSAHHVVKLLGVVSRGQPPLVVMELMGRGDLKLFLRQSRSSFSSITCAEMYRMSAEIADGMMYLTAKKFVHRDLAARNCMVSADHTVKIGDFGMTRDIYQMDYYRKESGGLMPIRWMSPESLADGVFSSDSDVWSYGVLLWEMATLAEQPYQGLSNEQVLQFVIAQGRLERPQECPDLLYEIMEACWKWKPNHRPLFTNIVEKLESHVSQHFRLVSFYHSAEGEDYRINAKTRVYNPPALSSVFSKNSAVYWNALDDDISI